MKNKEVAALTKKTNPMKGSNGKGPLPKKQDSLRLVQGISNFITGEEEKHQDAKNKDLKSAFGYLASPVNIKPDSKELLLGTKEFQSNTREFQSTARENLLALVTPETSIDIQHSNYKDNLHLEKLVNDHKDIEKLKCVFMSFNTKINDDAFTILAQKSKLSLDILEFNHCLNITDAGIKILTDPANVNFSSLMILNISNCDDITDEGLKMIAASTNFKNLNCLKMAKMYSMTTVGLSAILFSTNFPSLEKLSLEKNAMIDDSCIDLFMAQASIVRNLKKLNLNQCTTLTPEGVAKFLNSEVVKNLKSIKILGVKATRSIDNALAQSKYLENLETLQLTTSGEIKEFIRSENYKKLHSLTCIRTELTEREFEEIMTKRRTVKVTKKVFISDSKNAGLLGKSGIFDEAESLAISGLNQKDVFKTIFSKIEDADPYKIPNPNIRTRPVNETQESPLRVLQLASAPKIDKESLEYFNSFLSTQMFENLSNIRFYDVDISDMTLYHLGRAKMRNLLELTIEKCYRISEIGIKNIALSQNVRTLQTLSLKDWRISEHALKFISTSDNLEKLKRLELINIQINIAGVDNILTSTTKFKDLKYISLEKNNTLNDECANFIYKARGRFVQQVQTLKLDTFNKIKFTGWQKLKKITCVEIDLTSFEYNNDIYDINEIEDIASPNKHRLYNACSFYTKRTQEAENKVQFQELSIHSDEILTCDDLEKILNQPELNHLQTLSIVGFQNASKFFNMTKSSTALTNLDCLKIQRSDLSVSKEGQSSFLEDAKAFFTNCKDLKTLIIEECQGITDELVEIIMQCVEGLTSLEFATVGIKNASVKHIVNSPKCKNIKHLQLMDCDDLTDEAAQMIIDSPYLNKLTKLNMNECNGITAKTIHTLLRGKKFTRLTELRCNLPSIDCDQAFLDSYINSQMPNLLRIKLKFNEVTQETLKGAIKYSIGNDKSNMAVYCRKKHLKDILLNKLLKDKNLHLINNEVIKLLLENDQLRAVCGIPQRLSPGDKITNESVKMILAQKENPQFDLEMNKLVEFWNPIVESNNIIEIAKSPKLREELANADLKKINLKNDDKVKFAQAISTIEEMNDFLKKNTESMDDHTFQGLLNNPRFADVNYLDFKKMKVSQRVIAKIFSIKASPIDFKRYVELSGVTNDEVEGDIVVSAYINGKFSNTGSAPLPSEFKKINSDHTMKILECKLSQNLIEFHFVGQAVSTETIKMLGRKDCMLTSLKIIRFSDTESQALSNYGHCYFQSDNFLKIEELYLENLSLSEDFYIMGFGDRKGSLKKLSFKNINNNSADDNLLINLLLCKVFKTLEHLVIYKMKPLRETFLYTLTTMDLVNLKRLEVGKLSKYLNHELALEPVTKEEYFKSLELLSVKNLQLPDKFMDKLSSSKILRNLKEVHFEDINISQKQLETFLMSPIAANIHTLDVKAKQLDPSWVESICANPLKKLEKLIFANTDELQAKNLNFDSATINIIKSDKFESLNLEYFVEKNPQVITDNVLEKGICESKRHLKEIKNLDLKKCNLSSKSVAKFVSTVKDVQTSKDQSNFKFEEFKEQHKECHFLDDTVLEKLEEILKSPDAPEENEASDRLMEAGDKYAKRSRLRKLIRTRKVRQVDVNYFFSTCPDFVDDDLIINTFVKYRWEVLEYCQRKMNDEIIIRLNNTHVNVKKAGLEAILCKYLDEFKPDYDWVLLEERWRSLLTVRGLRVIAQDVNDLEYVVDFTFGKNYYLSTVGNQFLLRKEVEDFLEKQHIMGKTMTQLDYGERCAYYDVQHFIEDLIDKRVDWERIDSDEEVVNLYLDLIKRCKYIKHIDLEDKNLGDRFVKELCKIICANSLETGRCFIETINLKNNPRITLVGLKYIYATLYGNNTIRDVDVDVDPEYRLEFNNMVNYGLKFMINTQLHEYLTKCLKRKEYKIYDNLCIPISLYACCCMPVAYYHYNEVSINEKIRNSAVVRCVESILPKKTQKQADPKEKTKLSKKEVNLVTKSGDKISSTYFVFGVNMAQLNINLKKPYWTFLFFIYFLAFYTVSIVPPILTLTECTTDTPWISTGIYIGFAVFAFVFEYALYRMIAKTIQDPDIIKLNLGGIINVASSQVNKFSFYSNNIFIIQLYYCGYKILAYISIGFAAFFAMTHVYYLVKIFLNSFKKVILGRKDTYHTTKYINKCGKFCFHLEFGAISKVLERFASSTSVKIRGFYYPQVIVGALSKFIIGDLPQVIIKLFYIISNPSSASSLILLSLISNGIKLAKSFFAALEAKPTVVETTQIKNLASGIEKRSEYYLKIQTFYDQAFRPTKKDDIDESDLKLESFVTSKLDSVAVMVSPKSGGPIKEAPIMTAAVVAVEKKKK